MSTALSYSDLQAIREDWRAGRYAVLPRPTLFLHPGNLRTAWRMGYKKQALRLWWSARPWNQIWYKLAHSERPVSLEELNAPMVQWLENAPFLVQHAVPKPGW